jgi:hypothetical protein
LTITASGSPQRCGDRVRRVETLEPGVAAAKHDALEAAPTRGERHPFGEERGVVPARLGSEEVHGCDIAFAASQGGEAAGRTHPDGAGTVSSLAEQADHPVKTDAMAADDRQIRRP